MRKRREVRIVGGATGREENIHGTFGGEENEHDDVSQNVTMLLI